MKILDGDMWVVAQTLISATSLGVASFSLVLHAYYVAGVLVAILAALLFLWCGFLTALVLHLSGGEAVKGKGR